MIRATNPLAVQFAMAGAVGPGDEEGGAEATGGKREAKTVGVATNEAVGAGVAAAEAATDGKGAADGDAVEQAARSRLADRVATRGRQNRSHDEDRME